MTTDLAHSLKTRMWGEGAGVTAASRAVIARAGAGRPPIPRSRPDESALRLGSHLAAFDQNLVRIPHNPKMACVHSA